MKQITYIEFSSGWRPPAYKHLYITNARRVRTDISKNGHPYSVMVGDITDEDATYLVLVEPKVRIKNIE